MAMGVGGAVANEASPHTVSPTSVPKTRLDRRQ
jgi:hypothetical protein